MSRSFGVNYRLKNTVNGGNDNGYKLKQDTGIGWEVAGYIETERLGHSSSNCGN
ncbi:hypothetical protein SDC9_172316 [bioreactor metagenome]|uniref:Uncharacterized protein n=1 Tax=bioreactor metagenome TaxID=1076179 RepID=A0A645GDB6_9ZZZZ